MMNHKKIAQSVSIGLIAGLGAVSAAHASDDAGIPAASPLGDKDGCKGKDDCGGKDGCGGKKDEKDEKKDKKKTES